MRQSQLLLKETHGTLFWAVYYRPLTGCLLGTNEKLLALLKLFETYGVLNVAVVAGGSNLSKHGA